MSGGGGFRGRGFGSRGPHHHQGSNGPGGFGSRSNGPLPRSRGLNSRGSGSRIEGSNSGSNLPGGSRSNEHNPRSIVPNLRPDGPNARQNSNFRGGGMGSPHGPRPNFNLPRRPPRHPSRPSDKWAPRGGPPHFTSWRGGRPTRFNGPPRPFYRGRGQNNYGQHRFPYMGGNIAPLMLDFPPIPEPKPATPHLGSEEERLQKITEAADELKRKLSAVPNGPDVWYNDNEDDTATNFTADVDYESRIINRGIPELKHDPPELNLTLNDLRDIGRVDHDHASKQAKASAEIVSNSSFEDSEVTILDYCKDPVETTIEIDIWSDDNFVEFEDDNLDGRPIEQSALATDTTGTSQNTFPDVDQDQIAMYDKIDSIADENTSQTATTNEDSQELRKMEKPEEEPVAEAEVDQRNDSESRNFEMERDINRVQDETTTETSEEKIQDTRIEDNITLHQESSTYEENTNTLPEDNVNCKQSEQLNEETSQMEENREGASQDKKFENVQIKLDDVTESKTITGLSDKSVATENEIHVERINEARDYLESEIGHEETSEVSEALLNENESAKESSADDSKLNNESIAANESRDKPETTVVAIKTKASVKQMSNEIDEDTMKYVSRVDIASEVRKDDASLEVSQETLSETRSEKKSSLASDNERSKAPHQQEAITKKVDNASMSDERQTGKEKTMETRSERKREESKKDAKDNDTRKRRDDSSESSSRSDRSKSKSNSNGKTEAREKTEISTKVDATKDKPSDKKIVDKRKYENSSPRDKKIDDPKSPIVDNEISDRRKVVRKMPERSVSPRNQKSTLADSPAKSPNLSAVANFEPSERPPIVYDRRGPQVSRQYSKKNLRTAKQANQETLINHQPPPVFDPRLSSQERSALLTTGSLAPSSISVPQDPFSMAPGYPPCPMPNFVPTVTAINYAVPPPMIGAPPVDPPIRLPDPFNPLLSLPTMPATIPLLVKPSLLLQPPPPIQPPPPPPPPVKSNLDMVDELEDMQEAMEFAKKFLNMGDVGDIGDVDDSVDSDFFHMPTFPDLPPIELPPLPPPDILPPSAIRPPLNIPPSSEIPPKSTIPFFSEISTPSKEPEIADSPTRRPLSNKNCKKSVKLIKQEPMAFGPLPMPEEFLNTTSTARGNVEESSILTDESHRPKVVFNLSAKTTKLSKPEAWQQQEQYNADGNVQSKNKLLSLPISIVNAIVAATKEKIRVANGHEDREATRIDGKSSRFNGIVNYSQIKKSEESLKSCRSRSPSPSKCDKNSKDEEARSTPTDAENRRTGKDISSKKSTESSGTPESSWKSRVIGRFLKMSKNDICNMLNNTSLRKFDIAMKHLVKERRSSLSLGMRNNEEERMKGADVSYNREEFMDQLSAMLDPSATVDVCNLPTQFIHHLSEVLQLDSMSDFEAALTPSETLETATSPTSVQPPPSVRRVPRASSGSVKEIDDRRPSGKKGRDKKSTSTCSSATAEPSVATTPATVPPSTTVTRKLSTRTCEDSVETRCVNNAERIVEETITNRVTLGPRARRRRVLRPVIVEQPQDSMTVNNGSTSRNDANSLNMADLDDIFTAGIARERKKLSGVATAKKSNDKRSGDFNIAVSTGSNEVAKDPSVDGVERAAVELDKIFTAGIARFKLPSIKAAAAAAKAAEANDGDDDDEEGNWNREGRKSNLDSSRTRQRSMCRFVSRSDKWSRRKVCEDRDAFRNLTKEEWEARYGESSYTSYEQEYRAMVAMRSRRNDCEAAPEAEEITGVKSRLGNEITGDTAMYEAWSDRDVGARFRNADDPMKYEITAYNRNSDDSSSSSSLSTSSESSEEEAEAAPSVTKLLKVIKAKEKIAKKKSLNEEIRDEVAAEIERKRRERGKVRKSRHKSRLKKSHRRRKDRKEKVRDRRKKGRKRRKRKSRRSGSNSRESSDDEDADEEYTSSASRGRKSSRLLTENEIKKEIVIKDEPEPESVSIAHVQIRSKSSLALRLMDESRPTSTSSCSSMPAVPVISSSVPSPATNQPKTKAQLKQMPATIVRKVVAATVVPKVIPRSQELPASEAKEVISKIVAPNSTIIGTPPIISEAVQSPVASSTTSSGSLAPLQPTSNTSDEASSSSKSNSKKLDIKAYKERTRQRQIRENEKLLRTNENLNALTGNLNIPGAQNKVGDTTKDAVESTEQLKDFRMGKVEESKSSAITCKTSNPAIISTSPSISRMIAAATSPQTITSMATSSRTINSTATNPRTISSTSPIVRKIISTTTSPATTSVAEAAKVSSSESNGSQPIPSKNISSKKLIRRRTVTTAPKVAVESATPEARAEAGKFAHIKSEGSKELKLREKLKKSRPRPAVEGLESTILPTKPARVKKRSSVSSGTTTDERAVLSSEKSTEEKPIVCSAKMTEKAIVPSEKLTEEQAIISSEKLTEEQAIISSEKLTEEQAIISSEKLTEEQAIISSEKLTEEQAIVPSEKTTVDKAVDPSEKTTEDKAVDPSEKCIEEPSVFASEKRTEEPGVISSKKPAEEPSILSSEQRTEDPAIFALEKHAEEATVLTSEHRIKEPEIFASEQHTEEPEVFASEEIKKEPAVFALEKIEAQSAVFTSEKITTNYNESAVISSEKSTEESALIPSEKPTEESTLLVSEENSDVIESRSNRFDLFKKGLSSDLLPDTIPQEYLPRMHIAQKLDEVIAPTPELDPLALPIADLPGWSLEASISPNHDEELNNSSDDPPFRGFTKDSIILRDRVLTEAEGNISEMDDLVKVPLAFEDDPDAPAGGVLDLEDVTSTGVSLDAPLSYGDEEFVAGGVETSLLGFPVENDMTDAPESIALGSENDLVTEDIDRSTVKLFPEDSSHEPTDIITRVTPSLSDSPAPENFLIAEVQRQESIPSPLLVTEPVGDEPKESPDLSPKDNVDEELPKENTDGSRVDAAEVRTSHELEDKETAGTTSSEAAPLAMEMGSLQSSDLKREKEIYFQMERLKTMNEENFNILSESQEKHLDKSVIKEAMKETNESQSKNTTPVDPVLTPRSQRGASSDIVEETNKEIKTEKLRSVEETRLVDVKAKDSHRGSSKSTTKETHGRSKKKSSRHHNHAPRADKKSTITEKMVEEAITANIVKLVPKPSSKESVLARMIEIDVEIHKLMNEKMTLYTMLQSGEFPGKDNVEEDSGNKTNDEAKLASEREEAAIPDIAPPTVLASHLARNLDKSVLMTQTRVLEPKKIDFEGKTKKRKKSPQREAKHRGKESEVVETRRDRKNSDSKNNHSRRTASEESSRHESASRHSREKSTSSTDLEEAEENRRKRKAKITDSSNQQAARRAQEHSSKEDLREASRESVDRSGKSAKHESSPKREKSRKKSSKSAPEAKKIDEDSKKGRKAEEEKCSAIDAKPTEKVGPVIYSDESTWDSLDPEVIPSDEQRGKKDGTSGSCTGLALLEESFKREIAQTRKLKAVEKRKNKKQELRRVILKATTLPPDEEEIPQTDLYDRKNAPKKEPASRGNKGKSVTSSTSNEDPVKIWKHITSVIDAVAADRVEELYAGETSPISDDSTPATSTSIRIDGTELERERSPSISVDGSTSSGTADSIKNSEPEKSETARQRETDSRESDRAKPEEETGSKVLKKSSENDENYLSESKESEIGEATSASERSSPVEDNKKSRDVDTSSNESTPKVPIADISAEKEDDEELSAIVDKSTKKNELAAIQEKETELQAAEASRSPSPEVPSTIPPRSKSVETKFEAKEKNKYESSSPKEESPIESSVEKSAEDNDLVHPPKEADDERVRSHSRSERPSKRRSITPRETDREREKKEKHSPRAEESPIEPSVEKSAEDNDLVHPPKEADDERVRSHSRSERPSKRRSITPRETDREREKKEKHSSRAEESPIEPSVEKSAEDKHLVQQSKETDDERVRSHGRSERPSKRRSITPRETDREREKKEKHSSRAEENNDHDEKLSGRPKSATKHRQREKSVPPNRRSSRYSEDSVKRYRSKKRDRERSDSRGASSHDGESSRKKAHHSHRSSSPKNQAALAEDQARRRGRKRKRRPELSREEMMNCKVQLIDCKYTYLSPDMHPRVLKKFGISRINPYVAPTLVAESSSPPPQLTGVKTPSPPTLSKAEVPKETIEESSSSPKEVHNEEEKLHGDDGDEDDEVEDDDGVDETIHIVKAVENIQNAVISDQEEYVDVPEIIHETSCPADVAMPDVISVEDETTDEIEPKNDTPDEVEVIEEKIASTSGERSIEQEQKSPESEVEEDVNYENRRTRYTVHKGPILDIKVLDDSFLAASEDGAIYRYSQTSNGILNIYKGHEAAVTCIYVLEMPAKRWNLYSGSLDGTFRCYDITPHSMGRFFPQTGVQERLPADVGSPVQCMDQAWGVIFVGTKSGHISRYNIKSGSIKGDKLVFSDNSVLALKASSEGPRRVLIVASRNQPITIRDALTGLFLRTICGYKSHTVYSLMRERNLVYCGTSSTSIPVFDFTNGEQVTQYNAGVGIVCMRLYRQILFAGCYDGNIYVFDTKEPRLIVSIPGPGNMLLSMEVINDQIIAGSKNRQLHSWRMPRQIRALLSERT